MRSLAVLALLVVGGWAFFGQPASAADAGGLAARAIEGPSSTRLILEAGADGAFSGPQTRFVAIPAGAVAPQVRLVAVASAASGSLEDVLEARVLDPVIIRGTSFLPVVVAPVGMEAVLTDDGADGGAEGDAASSFGSAAKAAHEPSAATVSGSAAAVSQSEATVFEFAAASASPIRRVELEVSWSGAVGLGSEPSSRAARHGRGFYEALKMLLPAEQVERLMTSGTDGSYLIITPPQFVAGIEPLAQWKREKGLTVEIATTDQTGNSNTQIRSFIGQRYREAEIPPEYVLLVGDHEQIPAFGFHGPPTDNFFAMQDGDDFFPDLHVGRLPAQNATQLETMVRKFVGYESEPSMEGGGSWMGRGLMVGYNFPAQTPIPVSRWCRSELLRHGWSVVDSAYTPLYPPPPEPPDQTVERVVNEGVGIVSYRGWALAEYGWAGPEFLVEDVRQLTNTWKLPAVFSWVCTNGKFDEPECFGEAWVRSGTPDAPRGGIAFVGNGESWSHTVLNDAAAIGAFSALGQHEIRSLSAVMLAAKYYMLGQFPLQIPYDVAQDWSVEFNFHIYNLLGDPEMDIWAGPPRAISVEHPPSVPSGTNFVEVRVADEATGSPIAGVRVGLSRGAVVLGNGWTDAAGIARIDALLEAAAEPVLVTVTENNVAPYQGNLAVASGMPFLGLGAVAIDDDALGNSSGNADGVVNPDETLELTITVRNLGPAAVGGAQVTIEPDAGVEVVTASASVPAIPAGGQAATETPVVVRVAPDVEDGRVLKLRMRVTAGTQRSESDLLLAVQAPGLVHAASVLAEGALPAGGESGLAVSVRNDGSVAAGSVSAVLRSMRPDLVTVLDSVGSYGRVDPEETVEASGFRLRAAADAPAGQAALLRLVLTSVEGYVNETTVSVPVGSADHTAPLGADAYGYWAYDNTDTDYPAGAPLYEWVECSTAYGGSGTRLDMRDNQTMTLTLPFPFTYYGVSYDRILVSDNGWIAFDITPYYDYYNWSLPNDYGCGAQVAVFWDNLDPRKRVDGALVGDGVYHWYDEANHRYIVEWSRQGAFEYDPAIPFRDLNTFEVILYDPQYHPTPTGDGILQFQYKQVFNVDSGRMYATVGLEDHTESIGLEYTFSNVYPQEAAPVGAGLAIRMTTMPARYVPFDLASFSTEPTAAGVRLSWTPIDDRPRGSWTIYRSDNGGAFEPIATLDASARSFVDAGAPSGVGGTGVGVSSGASGRSSNGTSGGSGNGTGPVVEYRIGSLDPVGRETVVGPYPVQPAAASLSLALRTPNPVAGACELQYAVPRDGKVALRIYDVGGRLVRTLVDGPVAAGRWEASFDGRDARGEALPGGVYFARIEAGNASRNLKLVLVK